MFLYMPPILGLLQFIHSRKAALAIWCFDLTTKFQPGMLNLPPFFLPFVLITRDVGPAEHWLALHTSFLFLPDVSHLYN